MNMHKAIGKTCAKEHFVRSKPDLSSEKVISIITSFFKECN